MISNETYNVWFAFCVWILSALAEVLGTTYEIVNIWIFCFIGPLVFLVLFVVLVRQWSLKNRYKRQLFIAKLSNP